MDITCVEAYGEWIARSSAASVSKTYDCITQQKGKLSREKRNLLCLSYPRMKLTFDSRNKKTYQTPGRS